MKPLLKNCVLTAFALSLFTNACNTAKCPGNGGNSISIYGFNWYLRNITLPSGKMDISSKTSYINFDEEKKSAGGNGGCNQFGGSCIINGKSLAIKNMFATEMYCEEFHLQEENFFRLLQQVNKYDVKDSVLTMYRDNDLLLEFKK